jgi:hypothetical protein
MPLSHTKFCGLPGYLNSPSPVSRDAPYTRLRIEVWDYDLVGVDDFMGEVTIDLTYLMTGKVFVTMIYITALPIYCFASLRCFKFQSCIVYILERSCGFAPAHCVRARARKIEALLLKIPANVAEY